jgi:hypothetical protein
LVPKVDEGVERLFGDKDDVAAIAAVAAVGATLGKIAGTQKGQAAITALPCLNAYARLINELHEPTALYPRRLIVPDPSRTKKPRMSGASKKPERTCRSARDSFLGYDAHVLALLGTTVLELDGPVGKRKQRVIAAYADIVTGVETRATLAHKDASCADFLTAEALDAQAFAF